MKILGAEYSEYVVGFIIHTDIGDVDTQFQKKYSNHPEPAFELRRVHGGLNDYLKEQERYEIDRYIADNAEIQAAAKEYTEVYYSLDLDEQDREYSEDFREKFSYPIAI